MQNKANSGLGGRGSGIRKQAGGGRLEATDGARCKTKPIHQRDGKPLIADFARKDGRTPLAGHAGTNAGECAKQSQSPERRDKGARALATNALRRHYERGLLREAKPIQGVGDQEAGRRR